MAEWDFSASPVAFDYMQDRSPFCCAVGPVGSGKSVPSLLKIAQVAQGENASSDGVRRSRIAVIRNTYPELKSTTAHTFDAAYPEESFGPISWASPPGLTLTWPGIECKVLFLALDKPQDVKRLLSLELTAAFINEVRETPRSVVMRMGERVGRYLLNERPTRWRGVWADTNPPDAGHYLEEWDKKERPEGFRFLHQPPGVLECKIIDGSTVEVIDENFPRECGRRPAAAKVLCTYRGKVQLVECPLEVIRAAGREWIVNPAAENHVALSRVSPGRNPLGRSSYYGAALAGKTLEEIRSYLQGVYTFVSDGKRVVPQYDDEAHSADHVPVLPDVEILMGMDIGGGTLQPSCVFFQRHPRGPYLVHGEVVCFNTGIDRFGDEVNRYLNRRFPEHVARKMIGAATGDPAGVKRDEIFEVAAFDHLRAKKGIRVIAAPTQDPKLRAAAIGAPCSKMIDGKPGLILNRAECKTLRRGLQGAWHYKRVAVPGETRYADKPNKTDESHICDALGYGLLEQGEAMAGSGAPSGPVVSDSGSSDFDPFA